MDIEKGFRIYFQVYLQFCASSLLECYVKLMENLFWAKQFWKTILLKAATANRMIFMIKIHHAGR